MYIALIVLLLTAGMLLVLRGRRRAHRPSLAAGLALLLGTPVFFVLLGLWGELLWFQSLGLTRRFWVKLLAISGTAAAGALLAWAIVALISWNVRQNVRLPRKIGLVLAALGGALWGAAAWDVAVPWLFRVDTGVEDPVFGADVGFYLFSLPFYDSLFVLLLGSTLLGLALQALGALGVALPDMKRLEILRARPRDEEDARDRDEGDEDTLPGIHPPSRAIVAGSSALLIVLGFGTVLSMFHRMYSSGGIVYGPSFTDVHVRIPAYAIIAALLIVSGLALFIPRARRFIDRTNARLVGPAISGPPSSARSAGLRSMGLVALPGAAALLLAGLGLFIVPSLVQWLEVSPNELAREKPYIENNIAFTRRGFGLDKIESREFPISGAFTQTLVEQNDSVLSEVRLWDPRALDEVLEQFQEIRLYYEITRVDIDRYDIDGRYRQVMVAPREMETTNLPADSQTFVNRHFKYTHGYGLAMAPVSDFTKDGLPKLVVRDIPPESTSPSIRVTRPEIYFGERTDDFVVVDSLAAEFDYPSGRENVYVHYAGDGGIPLDSVWRRFVFGWKLGGTRLLLSDYLRDESRIMYRRNVHERVREIAPFLELDDDPYAVLVDGRLKWIVDGYTTSTYYPYSEPVQRLRTAQLERSVPKGSAKGVPSAATNRDGPSFRYRSASTNYVRNSVKAVVDAYDGSVALYGFDADDPILRVWSRIFPSLVRPSSEMPPELRAHVRYPEGFLRVQGAAYAKYHMTDPEVFYNQEDLWVHATEKHYGDIKIVDPYYVMWQPPEKQDAEFIIMQPFTPKNRQVLVGWIAGMCDGENYGRLLSYRFPKDRLVIGPQQVDTKIDQDAELSAQLTLWDQHGKRVIRGNVLAIPIDATILYVEPIYIQAQAAAYPELRVVVAMHGERMSHGPTFQSAIEGLLGKGAPATARRDGEPPEGVIASETLERAQRAFDAWLRLTGEGRFPEAAAELDKLREALLAAKRESNELPTR